jgi:hypothetical protein
MIVFHGFIIIKIFGVILILPKAQTLLFVIRKLDFFSFIKSTLEITEILINFI